MGSVLRPKKGHFAMRAVHAVSENVNILNQDYRAVLFLCYLTIELVHSNLWQFFSVCLKLLLNDHSNLTYKCYVWTVVL